MPTNLNALIRYKQIDACLKNKYVRCTIERLQKVCTEALGEHRGIYKQVSERTIREDIRVMRSDILGFNAPIEYENGAYRYTDEDYSIFKTPVTEVNLLKDILKMLLKEKDNINDTEIDTLLIRISLIVGESLPAEIDMDKERMYESTVLPQEQTTPDSFSKMFDSPDEDAKYLIDDEEEKGKGEIDQEFDFESREKHQPSRFLQRRAFPRINIEAPKEEVLMLWDEILKVI